MTWDGFRGTLQWMLLLLLIGVIAVGAAGLHLWSQKEVLIHDAVGETLASLFPSCHVSFRDVRIIDASEVAITDLQLRARGDGTMLVSIPRLSVLLDGEILTKSRRVVIKRLHLDSPQLTAIRNENGDWNWSKFQFQKSSQAYSPTIVVKNGQMQVGMKSFEQGPLHIVESKGIELSLAPEAKQRYHLTGSAVLEAIGPLSLQGMLDTRTGAWQLAGRAGEIRIDEPFLDRTGKWIPEVESRMAQLRSSPQFQDRRGVPVQTVSSPAQPGNRASSAQSGDSNSQSFLRADVDLRFTLGQTSRDAALDYYVKTKIDHGQVSDLFLPIPLYDITAQLEMTPRSFKIEKFSASNNQSSLFIDGVAERIETDWTRQFVVRATNLQIDQRIQSILPSELLKFYQLISPSGTFDLDFDVTQQRGAAWAGVLRKFTAKNCRIVHDYFRYPLDNINGEIVYTHDRFVLGMTGKAGQQNVTCQGYFGDGKLSHDAELTIDVKNLPVDERFANSFGRRELVGAKNALKSLRLAGTTDLQGKFVKNEQTGHLLKMQLTANVRDATLNFVNFPYELEGLSGKVTFNNMQKNAWHFTNLKARHGHALLSGSGELDLESQPGRLSLELSGIRIPIDADLEKASLTSMPHIEPLWTDFGLGGTADVEKLKIDWQPGSPTQVSMQGIQWKDGTIKPLACPYQWNDVVGTLEWTGKRLIIHSLHGWHNETYLEIKGTDPEWPTFVEVPANGPVAWEVHFGNMLIVKAKFDEELERALPTQIANTLKGMDLKGYVDVQLRADMRGWTKDKKIVTANWELQTVLEENALFAGLQLSQVSGKVKIRDGLWDGTNLRMEGAVDLKKAVALNMPFTNIRSPFHLEGSRLTIGTPKFIDPPVVFRKPNEFAGKQLRADLYTGQIGYDALVLLGPRPELTQFKAELNVNDVELAAWAADQATANTQRLSGKVNGIMAYQGIGPNPKSIQGKGWINIVPAAIMDLPAFAQMFAVINFRPTGNAAFNYAYGDFEIQSGRFEFSRIELRGEALGLIGKGIVGFAAGNESLINLTFDSRANNRIPLIGRIVEGIGNSWIRVQVTGTVAQPVPVIQPRIAPLDDAFREFTDAIEKGRNIRPPVRLGSSQ